MAKFKGTGPTFIAKVLKSCNAEGRFNELLSPEDKKLFSTCLPITWVPEEFWGRVLEAAALAIHHERVETGIDKISREMARDNIKGIYNILVKICTVQQLVNQSAKLWSQYHDEGSGLAEKISNTCVIFRVTGYPGLPKAVRLSTAGYLYGVLEAAGCRSIVIQLKEADPHMWEWIMTWA